MITVTIARQPSSPNGTFGALSMDNNSFTCVSLELPWNNDLPNVSCIPAGTYQCLWKWSPTHNRNNYHIQNVPNRTNCEIHAANVIFQLLGCIALGQEQCIFPEGTFPNVNTPLVGVQHSQATLAEFESILNGESFTLTIMDPQ